MNSNNSNHSVIANGDCATQGLNAQTLEIAGYEN